MTSRILKFLTTAMLASVLGTASAQTYPTKPIRFIVDFPAGGVSDILARVVGDAMSKDLGEPLVYENKPGAGGRVPYAMVAKSTGDGYTIGFVSTPFVLLPNLFKSLNYDSQNDFLPVGLVARYPNVLLVNAKTDITTMKQFLEKAKAKGNALNYGSFGIGSSPHLTMELFRTLTDMPGTHVPYSGSAQGMQALMGEQIDVIFGNIPGSISQIKAGRIRPLVVTGQARSSALPDVPTTREAGLTFDAVGFAGIVVPAGTPQPIILRLNQALAKAVSDPDVMKRVRSVGAEPAEPMSPKEFQAFLDQEVKTWAPVIKRAGGPFDN